ncbi:MAG: phosphatidylglycerophosphatase A [Proteobacteria bacterium]|nr:phosphatidylglycerophosphatase A [Pseudomonadota bacterium]
MARQSRRLVLFFASGCCAGYAPVAPGTAGSAVGLLLFYLLANLPLTVYCGLTCIIILLAVWLAGTAEKFLGTNDPPQVVIDEIAGQLITLAAIPAHWTYMLAGFFLFRLLDIIKPWPANKINRGLHGGAGIVLDDVVAGLYANFVLQLARVIF